LFGSSLFRLVLSPFPVVQVLLRPFSYRLPVQKSSTIVYIYMPDQEKSDLRLLTPCQQCKALRTRKPWFCYDGSGSSS
jgi:hypothetical protein